MIAGAAIAGGKVHDYWILVKNRNGEDEREVLLEVPKETSEQIIAWMARIGRIGNGNNYLAKRSFLPQLVRARVLD